MATVSLATIINRHLVARIGIPAQLISLQERLSILAILLLTNIPQTVFPRDSTTRFVTRFLLALRFAYSVFIGNMVRCL